MGIATDDPKPYLGIFKLAMGSTSFMSQYAKSSLQLHSKSILLGSECHKYLQSKNCTFEMEKNL